MALSIQFAPIQGFSVLHLGLFWQRIRNEYPRFEIQPAIPNLTEQYGPGANAGAQLGFTLLAAPELRCWYLDQTGNEVIQTQQGRFVHNWRKQSGTEPYPRYPTVRERLEKEWVSFRAFLKDEKLEPPKVNQCEVTYVNHIEYGMGWNGYGELDKVVATLATPKARSRFLPDPERVAMEISYRLEENAGRLHVSFIPVIRSRDGKEVLQMQLTARGVPKSASDEDVFAWLDLGRKWVVRGFADFTTEAMHNIWGKQ